MLIDPTTFHIFLGRRDFLYLVKLRIFALDLLEMKISRTPGGKLFRFEALNSIFVLRFNINFRCRIHAKICCKTYQYLWKYLSENSNYVNQAVRLGTKYLQHKKFWLIFAKILDSAKISAWILRFFRKCSLFAETCHENEKVEYFFSIFWENVINKITGKNKFCKFKILFQFLHVRAIWKRASSFPP